MVRFGPHPYEMPAVNELLMAGFLSTENRAGRRGIARRLGRKRIKAIFKGDPESAPPDGIPLEQHPCGWCIQAGRGPIPMGLHPKREDGNFTGQCPDTVIDGYGLVLSPELARGGLLNEA